MLNWFQSNNAVSHNPLALWFFDNQIGKLLALLASTFLYPVSIHWKWFKLLLLFIIIIFFHKTFSKNVMKASKIDSLRKYHKTKVFWCLQSESEAFMTFYEALRSGKKKIATQVFFLLSKFKEKMYYIPFTDVL